MNLKKDRKSQKLTLRIPISLYDSIKKAAVKDGTTLNQFCLYLLARGIGEKVGKKEE